jgi:very-short-patch-repair endonuclease
VTTVPRTIEDLRASPLPPHLVRRATRQAELAGHRLEGVESGRTRSDLEAAFLDLRRRGYTVLRFTDRQLEAAPERVAADVAAALSLSGISRG